MAKEDKGIVLAALLAVGAAIIFGKGSGAPNPNTNPNSNIIPSGENANLQNTQLGTPAGWVGAMQNFAAAVVNAAPAPGIGLDFVLAVSALETGYGALSGKNASPAFVIGNNCFGILADSSWTGDTFTDPTNGIAYRKYASDADSFADFLAFLLSNSIYAPMWQLGTNDSNTWAQAFTMYSPGDPQYTYKLQQVIAAIQPYTGQ